MKKRRLLVVLELANPEQIEGVLRSRGAYRATENSWLWETDMTPYQAFGVIGYPATSDDRLAIVETDWGTAQFWNLLPPDLVE